MLTQAIVLVKKNKVAVQQIEMPDPGPEQLQIRTELSTISSPLNRLPLILALIVLHSTIALGQTPFVGDDFENGTLGPQWQTARGKALVLDGALTLTSIGKTDRSYSLDESCYAEQAAPQGSNWEIRTRIASIRPADVASRSGWQQWGLMLHQDDSHWFGVWLTTNHDGSALGIAGGYQVQPDWVKETGHSNYGNDQARWGTESTPIWLMIRKSNAGYFGLASLDGEEWFHINQMIRNPENPATGSLTSETIRLFVTSPDTDAKTASGTFDFVHHTPIAPLSSVARNDEFDGDTLDSTRWKMFPGVPQAGEMSVGNGRLRLTPADWQDQWSNVDRAMRVYQIAPKEENWSVTIKAGPNDLRTHQDWAGYGMKIWQDQNHWVAVRNTRSNLGRNMTSVIFHNNNSRSHYYENVDHYSLPSPSWLRIVKRGSRYTGAYSFNGKDWLYLPHPLGVDLGSELQNAQIQLFAQKIRDAAGPRMTAEFDWVRVEKEPTP